MKLDEELNYRYKEQIIKLKSYLTVETAMLLFKYDRVFIIDNETLKILYIKDKGIYFFQKISELKRWLYWSGFLYHPVTKTIDAIFCSINNQIYTIDWYDNSGINAYFTVRLSYLNERLIDYLDDSIFIHNVIAKNNIKNNEYKFDEIDLQEELHLTTIDLNHIIITYFEKYGEIDTFITRYLDKLRPNKTKYRINLNTSKRQKKPRPKKK